MIRRIKQISWQLGDCGIACIAMVSGKKYERIFELVVQDKAIFKKIFAPEERAFCIDHKALQSVLERVKKNVIERDFLDWHSIKDLKKPAILQVKIKNKRDRWHWVVYAPNPPRILDPNPKISKALYMQKPRRGKKFAHLVGCGSYLLIEGNRRG